MKKIELSRRQKIAYYRWEFLRRNEEYIKDFKARILRNNPRTVVFAEDDKIISFFSRKYYIYLPLNPNYSFNDLSKVSSTKEFKNKFSLSVALLNLTKQNIRKNEVIYLPESEAIIDSYPTENPNIGVSRVYGKQRITFVDKTATTLDENPFLDDYDGDISRICIEVDLTMPRRMIDSDIKKEISLWLWLYQKEHKKKRLKISSIYDDMLKSYDLRKKGLSLKTITKKVYPRQNSDLKSAIERVRYNINKAKELIKDYPEIR